MYAHTSGQRLFEIMACLISTQFLSLLPFAYRYAGEFSPYRSGLFPTHLIKEMHVLTRADFTMLDIIGSPGTTDWGCTAQTDT